MEEYDRIKQVVFYFKRQRGENMNTAGISQSKNKNPNRIEVRQLVFAAAGAVLLAICSWINIPTTVPFTLQTFGVFFLLLILGGKMGTLSILVYILLGALGVPVFAGFSGGLGILFGSTGGYIIGFFLTGLIYAVFIHEKPKHDMIHGPKNIIREYAKEIFILLIGLFLCYLFGTVWFIVVYTKANGAVGILAVLSWCVIPFIIPDLIKLLLAVILSKRLKPIINKL